MTHPIVVKRSSVAGRVPTGLQAGELALNMADKRMYYRTLSETVPLANLEDTQKLTLNNGFPAHYELTGNNLVSIDSVTYLYNTKTNGNRNIYLSIAGDIASNINGYALPYNALIYSVTVQIGAPVTAPCTFEIRKNPTGAVAQSITIPAGVATVHVNNLALLLNVGDDLAMYITSSVNVANPLAVVRVKWRN